MGRVVVDLTKLKYLQCGLGQFALHLGRRLLEEAGDDLEFTFLAPGGAEALFHNSGARFLNAGFWRKEEVARLVRPWAIPFRREPAEQVWHATNQDSRYFPLDPRVPVVLTIHDLNVLREKPPAAARRRLRGVQRRIDRAAWIVTCSHFTAEEIRGQLELRGKPIQVIHHGVEERMFGASQPLASLPAGRFLFAIGVIAVKKNFHVLVDLMHHLPEYRLVIAGNKTTNYATAIQAQVARERLRDRVVLPGEVSDEERAWLYQNCEAVLFPSLAEGFGLPVVEAMLHGKPVFLSTATCLPEVGGPLAFYWRSFEPAAMARVFRDGMQHVATDPHYASKLQARAALFSWRAAARQYAALYREILGRARVAA